MRPTTKRIFSIVLAVLFFLASIVVFANLVRPAYEQTNKLRGEVATRTKILSEESEAIKQVQSLISQFQSVARLQDTISLALPLQPDSAQALSQYHALAQASDLTMQNVGVQEQAIAPPATDASGLAKGTGVLRFNLKLSASYSELKNFVRGLDTAIRLSDVVNLKMAPSGPPEQNLYNVDLTVNNYYQAK